MATTPAPTSNALERDPQPVVAERGDEHEQHAARHERLGARQRTERERVGEHHGERQPDRREHVPPAAVDHGCDGDVELLPDEIESRR